MKKPRKPLKRKTPLKAKTPLARSAFRTASPKPSPVKSKSSGAKTANLKLSKPAKPRKPLKAKARPKWKKKAKPNQDFYDQWGARQTECHCCGIDRELAASVRFPGTSTHHIAKAGRVHTATNLLHLCARCHDLAENLDTPVWLPDGTKWYYPKLTFANCHWLKREFYPAEYDAETLGRLRKQVLEAVEPPAIFLAERYYRAGKLTEASRKFADARWQGFPGETFEDLLGATMQPK